MTGAQDVLTATARVAFERAERADLRALESLLADLSGSTAPYHRAWHLALRAMRWSFDPQGEAPTPVETAHLMRTAGSDSEALLHTCVVMERVAFCMLDAPTLNAWVDLHAALVEKTAAQGGSDVGLTVARLWQRLLTGGFTTLDEAASAVLDQASRTSAASIVIEVTVIRALAALSTGNLDEAVELARRASRMAQAESLPHQEYLASIVLGRVRRYSARPHLALHILAALERVAPAYWAGWIGWEALLAGGRGATLNTPPDAVSVQAERALRRVLEAAHRGDRTGFDEARSQLEAAARAWPPFEMEATALIGALDPLQEEVPPAIRAWCSGETAALPFGLHGVSVSPSEDPQLETATAYVLGRPKKPGRRFLVPGLAFLAALPDVGELARDSTRSTPGRTETGLAALVLAGEAGTTRDEFFRRVYGFKFVPYRHRAVLDTLCHRMRSLVGEAGEIRREEVELTAAPSPPNSGAEPDDDSSPASAIALTLRQTIVVPDMRCILPTADRLLRALAVVGPTSASAAAEALRMPLRTIQAILQQLVAEGACTIERDGRRVAYRIQDTTFTEVTVADAKSEGASPP